MHNDMLSLTIIFHNQQMNTDRAVTDLLNIIVEYV